MADTPEWFDAEDGDGGVLELPETLTAPGPALELQVVLVAQDRVAAWWVTDRGVTLGLARGGQG